jgi:hypothetical protein
MSKRFWIALGVVIVSVAVVSGVVGGVWEIVNSLLALGFGVYCLLVVYRRVGPPQGTDARYDAWLKQWGPAWKFLGWMWVVSTGILLVIAVIALVIGRSVW